MLYIQKVFFKDMNAVADPGFFLGGGAHVSWNLEKEKDREKEKVGRQASEAQREKELERERKNKEDTFCWRNNMDFVVAVRK